MTKDSWNPDQYRKFKEQRSKPFWDLLDLVLNRNIKTIIDLGCGTGELTAKIQDKFPESRITGVDNSREMLKESVKIKAGNIHFEHADLKDYSPEMPFDLVFSNATLQWLPNHEMLFPRILRWVSAYGQVAIQMPYNFDHPSHQIAHEVALNYPIPSENPVPGRSLLSPERYAEILYQAGFKEQRCRIEVYLHPMASGADVVEWTRGTLLTAYQSRLARDEFESFLSEYKDRLLREIGEGSYVYPFKRILLWGLRND